MTRPAVRPEEARPDEGWMSTGTGRRQADFGKKWLDKGKEALERSHLSEAIESLRLATEADPHSIQAYLYLGIALAMDSQVYEAIDSFEAALALSPKDFMVNLKLAELYFRLCVPDKGHKHLVTAMEASSTPQERQLVRTVLSQEAERGKRRIDRPTFGKS